MVFHDLFVSFFVVTIMDTLRDCYENKKFYKTYTVVYSYNICTIYRYIYIGIHKYIYMDREGWWFEHSVSWLQVCLSAEGAKNVSWPWLSPLRGWGSPTMSLTGKFVYIYIHKYTLDNGVAGRALAPSPPPTNIFWRKKIFLYVKLQ